MKNPGGRPRESLSKISIHTTVEAILKDFIDIVLDRDISDFLEEEALKVLEPFLSQDHPGATQKVQDLITRATADLPKIKAIRKKRILVKERKARATQEATRRAKAEALEQARNTDREKTLRVIFSPLSRWVRRLPEVDTQGDLFREWGPACIQAGVDEATAQEWVRKTAKIPPMRTRKGGFIVPEAMTGATQETPPQTESTEEAV
jgi:hypothetical protein